MRNDISLSEIVIIVMVVSYVTLLSAYMIFPVEDVITNGTISKISIHDGYYKYDVDTGDRVLHDLISTNYYELKSEHVVYFKQDILGTSDERFV